MSDRLTRKSRSKDPRPPVLSCLRKIVNSDRREFTNDNTLWNKYWDGLLQPPKEGQDKEDEQKIDSDAERHKWKTISGIDVTLADKNDIIKGQAIADSIVNAAQNLLQKQYPNVKGLQNVLLYEIDSQLEIDWNEYLEKRKQTKELIQKRKNLFDAIKELKKKYYSSETEMEATTSLKDKETKEEELKAVEQQLSELKKNEIKIKGLQPLETGSKFVQIVLDRNENNHWVCVSNVRTNDFKTVRIYDNDLQKINRSIENYSVHLKRILKRLFRDAPDITLELPLVSQCYDHRSGGVYAIAFAEALCAGLDPSDILFSSNAIEMRTHLIECLEKGKIQRFPTGSTTSVMSFDVVRSWSNSNHR